MKLAGKIIYFESGISGTPRVYMPKRSHSNNFLDQNYRGRVKESPQTKLVILSLAF